MSDYIKREDVLRLFQPTTNPLYDAWNERIKEIPAADVVEVVRCKDCVFWECPNAPTHNRHMCSYWEVGTHDYDFCSDGERRSE